MNELTFSDFWKGILDLNQKAMIRQVAIEHDMTLIETIEKWYPEYWDKLKRVAEGK